MAVDILELAQTAPPEIRQKFQQREYSEGDCIISPAAMPTCCLYIVLSGLLKVQKESGGGNAIVVNTFSAGDVFGEVEIFSPEYKPSKQPAVFWFWTRRPCSNGCGRCLTLTCSSAKCSPAECT